MNDQKRHLALRDVLAEPLLLHVLRGMRQAALLESIGGAYVTRMQIDVVVANLKVDAQRLRQRNKIASMSVSTRPSGMKQRTCCWR